MMFTLRRNANQIFHISFVNSAPQKRHFFHLHVFLSILHDIINFFIRWVWNAQQKVWLKNVEP